MNVHCTLQCTECPKKDNNRIFKNYIFYIIFSIGEGKKVKFALGN